jgi:Saxitoxin biosynthesis operon protein SxtJ
MATRVPAGLNKTAAELRSFGLTVGGAFGVFGALAWAWRGHPRVGQVLLALAAVLAVGGLLRPTALAAVERLWMKLAVVISKVTTPIFMGVVYFFVLLPAGVLRRTLGTRVLEESRGKSTAWQPVRQSRSMERQF